MFSIEIVPFSLQQSLHFFSGIKSYHHLLQWALQSKNSISTWNSEWIETIIDISAFVNDLAFILLNMLAVTRIGWHIYVRTSAWQTKNNYSVLFKIYGSRELENINNIVCVWNTVHNCEKKNIKLNSWKLCQLMRRNSFGWKEFQISEIKKCLVICHAWHTQKCQTVTRNVKL